MGKAGNLVRLLRVATLAAVATVLVGVPLAISAPGDISRLELGGNAAGGDRNDGGSLRPATAGAPTTTWARGRRKPEVKVVKVTDPTSDAGRFNLLVNGNVERADATSGEDTGFVQVGPGQVTVGESAGAGTDLGSYLSKVTCDSGKGSADPATSYSFTVTYGDKVTCTITNTRKATLTVIKHVINDDGGIKVASDFPIQVAGNGPSPASFAGAESPGTAVSLGPGEYSVTETEDAGYTASYSAGCSGTLPAGGSATCTITNDDKPAKLVVIKDVINDNGGTKVASDFRIQVTGTNPSPASFAGAASPGTEVAIHPGSYSVTETEDTGYTASYSADCSGSITSGQTKTCTITNDDKPATLIVKKVVVNDNGGTKVASDFSFQVNGGAPIAFEAGGQNDLVVAAGTYTVTEPAVPGYATTYSGCEDVVLALGGTATCTITNNDVPRGRGSISVSKSASPTSLKEPGGQVAYSVSVTNTSVDVAVTIVDVVDDRFGDLDDEGGKGYVDVPFTLPPGGSKSFQFTAQVTGVGGSTHVNVVTASGRDASGNLLSGSDDARVTIAERLIDLAVVKDATSPTPLNGAVTYTLTVTNKGPDTATNVQLADPAPAGIAYLSATPSQGTCNVTSSLIACDLGTIAPGQAVTVQVAGRATQVGQHTNTATVTGSGGRETNPADNVDSALTVVPAPLKPPTSKPKPEPEVCLALAVSSKTIKADGKPDKVRVEVTAGKKPVKGVRVVVGGAGVKEVAKTNGKGIAVFRINPRKPGIITITALETKQKICGPKRIGVVGVFLPPLTG